MPRLQPQRERLLHHRHLHRNDSALPVHGLREQVAGFRIDGCLDSGDGSKSTAATLLNPFVTHTLCPCNSTEGMLPLPFLRDVLNSPCEPARLLVM